MTMSSHFVAGECIVVLAADVSLRVDWSPLTEVDYSDTQFESADRRVDQPG